MNEQLEALENELATLKKRTEEIAAEYSRGVVKRDAAREALISGSGTTTTLTQAQTTIQALDEARTELEKRIATKSEDIAKARVALLREKQLDELFASAQQFEESRAQTLKEAEEIARAFRKMPQVLELMIETQRRQMELTNHASAIGNVPRVLARDGKEIELRPLESASFQSLRHEAMTAFLADDLHAQRGFYEAFAMQMQVRPREEAAPAD